MTDAFESGFMVREPSWHRKERAVLKESPRSWEEAREQAGLTWEVEVDPVYGVAYVPQDAGDMDVQYEQIPGYQRLRRDDTHDVLSIRPSTYETIYNRDFGQVIDTVLGLDDDEYVDFEALMSLYEGRMIVAVCNFPTKLAMPWDPSANFSMVCMTSRHDGNGGLRGFATNLRVVCANTFNAAEMTDGRYTGFTVRHTSNWKERIAEIRRDFIAARADSEKWMAFTEQLALWSVTDAQTQAFLTQMFPISDAMSTRERSNRESERNSVRQILSSETCTDISGTGYGLLMATSEWSDHVRRSNSTSSYVSRQLLRKEDNKAKASSILREMADIKL